MPECRFPDMEPNRPTPYLRYITRPELITLLITVLIVVLFPWRTEKFRITMEDSRIYWEGANFYMEDLDGDGSSEHVLLFPNSVGEASFHLFNDRGELLNQWNFDGTFLNRRRLAWFTDVNRDGFKEVINFSRREDSVFLNLVQPSNESGFARLQVFIDTIGNYVPSRAYEDLHEVVSTQLYNDRGPGRDSLLFFSLESGYSGYPRSLYRLNLKDGSLKRSAHLGNRLGGFNVADLDGNGSPEFLMIVNSSSNDRWFHDTYFNRTDESSWLMILDSELEFFIPPREFKSEFSNVIPDTILRDNQTRLLVSVLTKRQDELPSHFLLLDTRGRQLDSTVIGKSRLKVRKENQGMGFLVYVLEEGRLLIFDRELQLQKEMDVIGPTEYQSLDIDRDGDAEWVFKDSRRDELQIYSPDFAHVSSIRLPVRLDDKDPMGVQQHGRGTILWIYSGDRLMHFRYGINPWYFGRLAVYPLIYLIIFGAVNLIMRAQSWQEKRKRDIERQIAELQIQTVKNQMDPHFVFNAISTIADMRLEDKWEADRFIGEYSDFMRRTISGSDKIIYSLREEIDYVENYIRLQKLRLGFDFRHEIRIADGVNLDLQVPKHLLYSYVENAVKHGLSRNGEEGLLFIDLKNREGALHLLVFNNAPLQQAEKDSRYSTGNGMRIMQDMFELYEKRYQRTVKIHVKSPMEFEGETGYGVELCIGD